MLRKRYYILFVARDEDGRVRKIPLPLHYAYGFVAAAVIGAFTIVGMAGSYTRMLLKTENFNQIRAERETLRKNYQEMARSPTIATSRWLRWARWPMRLLRSMACARAACPRTPACQSPPATSTAPGGDGVSPQSVNATIDEFATLRNQAMSGRIARALESGLNSSYVGDWTVLADAPSLWPVDGRVGSGFGERQDPINGEGAFHSGIDIDAPWGTPVRAAGDGVVIATDQGAGYGREITIDHGHDLTTIYGHLSSIAIVPGEHVTRGQIIGYVGQTGRATGPHLHYEVRVHNVPVNPHKYLRDTYQQIIAQAGDATTEASGN